MTIRRVGDIALALTLLVVCLPAVVLASLAVWLELSRSPFERIEHVARDGRRIRLWRFRTERQTLFGDRLTYTGRILRSIHLHHLPQLVNIIGGDIPLLAPDSDAAVPARKSFALRGP